jgi:adenine-specific DNA-methyltransferase
MYYSYILTSCLTKKNIDTLKVENIIKDLGKVNSIDGYISKTYSNGRMYFTPSNASKIDAIRTSINGCKEQCSLEEYNLLIKILLYSSTKVANISSTYGAYLKKYKKTACCDIKYTNSALELLYDEDVIIKNYNTDVLELVSKNKIDGDVCYLDPPYNSRKYSSNYFVIDSIAKYDNLPVSDGVTGVPLSEPSGSGSFCSKVKVIDSFDKIFSNINTNYIFMSYNSESLVSKDEIVRLLEKNLWKDVKVIEREYKRFKSNNNTNQKEPLYEYLFCAKKNLPSKV